MANSEDINTFVRVKDLGTKHEYTITKLEYSGNKKSFELLSDKDAVDSAGVPLPGKPYRSKIEPAEAAATRPEQTEGSAS